MTNNLMNSFGIKPIPSLLFGVGKVKELPNVLLSYGKEALLIIGSGSICATDIWSELVGEIRSKGVNLEIDHISTEPSPERVDAIVEKHKDRGVDVVAAIGGGSVLDAGKAISAMLVVEGSITSYLEGVGTIEPDGSKVPFIAIPTTSGTGSEMTSNAVISKVGKKGFKKSLRHDGYIPNMAIVDPALTLYCPKEITYNCTMDAFTQLVESYLSISASPYTDDLAFGAITRIKDPLKCIVLSSPTIEDRTQLSYGACISGITLANAGLGVVHGLASVIGGRFHIPHGAVCGTLMASANEMTLAKLRKGRENRLALHKYTQLGKLFCEKQNKSSTYYQDCFIAELHQLTSGFAITALSNYGIGKGDLLSIAEKGGNKNNPVSLSLDERLDLLKSRLG